MAHIRAQASARPVRKNKRGRFGTAAVVRRKVRTSGRGDRTEYITFSQHATKEFIRLAPKGTPVYYLTGDLTPKELKAWGLSLIHI